MDYYDKTWMVDVLTRQGRQTIEVQAIDKDHAIKRIKTYKVRSNSQENMFRSERYRVPAVLDVFWNTLNTLYAEGRYERNGI